MLAPATMVQLSEQKTHRVLCLDRLADLICLGGSGHLGGRQSAVEVGIRNDQFN